jgi:hypothetical protein
MMLILAEKGQENLGEVLPTKRRLLRRYKPHHKGSRN